MRSEKPSKAAVDRAVTIARLYHGSIDQLTVKDQQRLYKRLQAAMRPLESYTSDAWEQIDARARALGPIPPKLGKDV